MGRVLRKFLPRHASLIGGVLVTSTVVVLMALAALWFVANESHRRAGARANERNLEALAQTIKPQLERAIEENDLAGVRLIVQDATRGGQLAFCRVSLGDGGVLADADSSAINTKAIPEKLPALAASAVGGHRFELIVPGKGSAALEMEPGRVEARSETLEYGFAAAGVITLGLLGLASARARRKALSFTLVADALVAIEAGEKELAALELSDSCGGVGAAWNLMVRELAKHRARERFDGVLANRAQGGDREEAAWKMIDSLWHGVVAVDEEMRIRYCNGAAAVFLAGTRDGLMGTSLTERITDAQAKERIVKVTDPKNRGRIVVETKQGEGEDGSVLRFSGRTMPSTGGAVILIEDVTQQRVADRSKNAFVEQATHELRTPLTNVRLYVEALVDNPETDVTTRSQHLNVINQEVRRLERIVGDMLSVSEIEAGTLKLALHDVRLPTLFTDLEAEFAAPARAKNIQLKFDLHPKLPTIVGDRDKLVLAITNVIGNAIKYTPEGGTVKVAARSSDSELIVEIADSGIGIRAEDIDRVFERFYRARDPRVEKIVGTGLGLALSRDVMRLHGGEISVQSVPDKGSTFVLKLPLRSPLSRAA